MWRNKPFIDAHEFGHKGLEMEDDFLYIVSGLPQFIDSVELTVPCLILCS